LRAPSRSFGNLFDEPESGRQSHAAGTQHLSDDPVSPLSLNSMPKLPSVHAPHGGGTGCPLRRTLRNGPFQERTLG
jgi:hypothetical protein